MLARRPAHEDVGAEVLVEALDARGEVHGVAHQRVREPFRAADIAGEDAPAVDADPVAEEGLPSRAAPLVPRGQAPAHVEGGAHGHGRMVARGHRRAEHGLDLVADEL